MNLEETKKVTSSIREQMNELKEIEGVFLLAELFHYTKNLLDGYSTNELMVSPNDNRNISDDFQLRFTFKNEHYFTTATKGLCDSLYTNNEDLQKLSFFDEYKYVTGFIPIEDIEKIIVNSETTAEDFLGQISARYASIYMRYRLEKGLSVNNVTNKTKPKI